MGSSVRTCRKKSPLVTNRSFASTLKTIWLMVSCDYHWLPPWQWNVVNALCQTFGPIRNWFLLGNKHHSPMRVICQNHHWFTGVSCVPETNLAVISTAHKVILLVWVKVQVSNQLAMGILDYINLSIERQNLVNAGPLLELHKNPLPSSLCQTPLHDWISDFI